MINFTNLSHEKIDTSALLVLGTAILKDEGFGMSEEINCVFTDNSHIQQLNARFRKNDMPTDVLAFSFTEGEDAAFRENLFGDIYISVEMAAKNAKTYGQPFSREIQLLFVHGLLHLLGYGDESEEEKKVMKAKEDHYLKMS